MNKKLLDYLKDLRAYGVQNHIPNVTQELGRFLNMLVRIKKPKNILEIGCANGYSTIWLAEAAKDVGAKVHAVDFSRPSLACAKDNLAEAGYSEGVVFYLDDALKLIPKLDKGLKFELVFVDGEKASYLDFWKAIQDRLNPGAVIVFDDMIAFPKKTAVFADYIRTAEGVDQVLIPLDAGDGILMVLKR